MNELGFRNHVRNALAALNSVVDSAIASELQSVDDLDHSGRLQFEASPTEFSVHLIQTEEEVVCADAVDDAITFEAIDAAEEHEIDWCKIISDELVQWFADSHHAS
ncbi:MAG: hypothetical protein AAF585_19930 [Verrucomicrobiota bacterium]